MGIGLEPGIGWRSAVETGHDNRRDPACRHLIVHPCSATDVLSGPVTAHDPPVLHLPDIGDGSDIIPHGIADRNPLNLIGRAEAGEVGDAELLCFLPRHLELAVFPGKPHCSCAVIDPDEHSSNPIA